MRGEQRHPNDAMSVQAWVVEMKAKGNDNPALFYKPQGTLEAEVGANVGLAMDDFA